MYAARATHGPVELAFTDRHGGVSGAPCDSLNLAWADDDPEALAEKKSATGQPEARRPQPVGATVSRTEPGTPAPSSPAPREAKPMQFDDDDLDIPDFLK